MRARNSHAEIPSGVPIHAGGRMRASDLVYEDLAKRIRKVRLIPGQSISESEFAKYYGVSRTPVRAAIAALADDGMVRVTPQVGTRVSFINFAEVEQAQFIRESLETNALRYACEAKDRDFTEIRAVLEEQRSLIDKGEAEAFFLADEAFHRQTFVIAGYEGAWSVAGRTRFQLDRMRHLSMGLASASKFRELYREHEQLLEHVVNRDVDRAVEGLMKHIRRYMNESEELQREFPDYFEGYPALKPDELP